MRYQWRAYGHAGTRWRAVNTCVPVADSDARCLSFSPLSFLAGGLALAGTANDMGKFLSFLLRSEGATRDDSKGSNQPLDSATVRRWLSDRVLINPSNLNCSDCVLYTDWGVPWQNLRVDVASDPRMAGFSRYALFSKDGSVPGYNAQLVVQPELKLGLFTVMTVGPGGRENVPFFSNTLTLLNFAAAPPLYSYPQAFAHQPVLHTYKPVLQTPWLTASYKVHARLYWTSPA